MADTQTIPTPSPSVSPPVDTKISTAWWNNSGFFPITQLFGTLETVLGMHSPHTGLDIGLPMFTALTAPVGAKVVYAGSGTHGEGNYVQLLLDNGLTVLMYHMSDVAVSTGQIVSPGSLLGHSGSTGNSTGPHLHFEVRDLSGKAIDPWPVLNNDAKALAGAVGVGAKTAEAPLSIWTNVAAGVGHLFNQDHDPCTPPDNEGELLLAMDWLSCPRNRWRLLFISVGVALIVVGGNIYFFDKTAPIIVGAAKLGAEAAA